MTYETGATTHAANDLVLCTLNDGSIYPELTAIVWGLLQSNHRRATVREVVKRVAEQQRKTGSKYPAASITEAADIVTSRILAECCDALVHHWDGSRIVVQGYQWWDKVNGNTYSASSIGIPSRGWAGLRTVHTPFTYGSCWESDAVTHLRAIGFAFPDSVPRSALPIVFADCGYIKRAAMPDGLYIAPQA